MIEKIKNWFKSLFDKTKSLISKHLPTAVFVVQGVKKAIDSGAVDFFADIVKRIISGTADDIIIDKAIAFAKERIPVLCIQLEILKATNVSGGSIEVLQQALDALQDTYGDKWEEFTSGLAGELIEYLADGKIDAGEAKKLAKAYYDKNIKDGE